MTLIGEKGHCLHTNSKKTDLSCPPVLISPTFSTVGIFYSNQKLFSAMGKNGNTKCTFGFVNN